MKHLLLATLATTLLNVHAAENFGSIYFHSSVPELQSGALKEDLRYLFKTPILHVDQEFQEMTGLEAVDGPHMHNWIVNRVRYIVGENFQLENSLLFQEGFKFPGGDLPSLPGMEQNQGPVTQSLNFSGVKTVMTNVGGALYLMGKVGFEYDNLVMQMLLGLDLDGKEVYATSPRIGILQVGEGLFDEEFRLNADLTAPSNSISRIATLFHEARHSDGNGSSTSFPHALCPSTHAYADHYACENSANGPYSIGALSTRALMLNCTSCDMEEKTALAVATLDSFSRLLSGVNNAMRLMELQKSYTLYSEILQLGETMLGASASDEEKALIEEELASLRTYLQNMLLSMAELKSQLHVIPKPMDAAPEGEWTPVVLESSSESMAKELEAP